MADGPRCKRRKQANPRRNNVTNYSNVVKTPGSDSDDEDKLHIVEEDGSMADGADCDSNVPSEDHNGDHWDEVREECGSDGEDDGRTDALVEEMLQQGDTAVIYPEAPEDEPRQGTPEASGHDENGTPDAFSQLLTCPYCSRGYKRYTSLKEHIKLRHEKSEDNFSCSHCSYTFAYRTQLERHMTAHKAGRDQRHVTQSGVNRKFNCTECEKAFKYKHHLKEHLRIHSGEKPYECSNCKKRFSHSGSYSSHISSKKCISVISAVNGRPRPGAKASQCPSPAMPASPSSTQIWDKPFQEQLPLNQIKSEPVDYEYKAMAVTPATTGVNGHGGGVLNGGAAAPLQGAVQAVMLPTMGLVSPISINLADLQNILKVAVDGNMIRQMLENNTKAAGTGTGATGVPHQQLISAISLPIIGQDGNATKIIINYSLDPSQTQTQLQTQLTAQNQKKEPQTLPTMPGQPRAQPQAEAAIEPCSKAQQRLPEDLTLKEETTKTCLLCDNCPGGLDSFHALEHCKKASGLRINGDKSESVLSEGVGNQPKNLLSLLKAYFALNAEPTKEEVSKISDSVSLPTDVVKKWFDKMQISQVSLGAPTPPSEEEGPLSESPGATVVSPKVRPEQNTEGPTMMQSSPAEATPAEVNGSMRSPASPTPLNLTAGGPVPAKPSSSDSTDGPLDLSLPKPTREEAAAAATYHATVYSHQDEPLNLTKTCTTKKELLIAGHQVTSQPVSLYTASPQSANPISIMTTQLPSGTIYAITDQGRAGMPCLRAVTTSNNQTILIPQLAYTYTTTATASSPAGTETQEKTTLQINGIKEERQDTSSESVSTMEELNDSDSAPSRKKIRKTESGMYACDLCDKIFQKSSSLLRHKYEHTGKRPHECGICRKAFKHKHHLIEHMRLHSGEKPYQCDKCGKRFSHSGSYSQHMNHRYSYCKKEAQEGGQGGIGEEVLEEEMESPVGLALGLGGEQQEQSDSRPTSSHLDSDERGSSTREDEEESEEEGEEEDMETAAGEEEEGDPDRVLDMDDIQVVRIGDEGGNEEEEEEEEEEGEREEDTGQEEGDNEEEQGVERVVVGGEGEEGEEEEEEGVVGVEVKEEQEEEEVTREKADTRQEEVQENREKEQEQAEKQVEEEQAEKQVEEEQAEKQVEEEQAERQVEEEQAERQVEEEEAERQVEEEQAERQVEEEEAERQVEEEQAERQVEEEETERQMEEEQAERQVEEEQAERQVEEEQAEKQVEEEQAEKQVEEEQAERQVEEEQAEKQVEEEQAEKQVEEEQAEWQVEEEQAEKQVEEEQAERHVEEEETIDTEKGVTSEDKEESGEREAEESEVMKENEGETNRNTVSEDENQTPTGEKGDTN
ncbi:zinc finger E-box-binding homeobox 1 [Coregonus clupeaformis]|uniref:zinc finger E-box-binding homeobox 1 n=1 Tax=Coregonus clupeaformis TaxID=59861 RepID=UPI001E1C7500|nr:zinc finger E-box-binding homeobox 1 [Coregonus clupeaformis]